ncbi:MAG TPA: phage head morphogenesis protein [Lachnospiraceae bacterium]|nr:phage head morphogenesis protein [Lachnospiraceae bacterium]
MYESMELAERCADELAKAYLKSSRYISLKADEIFERFQEKHGLGKAEARRLISQLQGKESIQELMRLLEASGKKDRETVTKLESAAFRSRLERLAGLQRELDRVMQEVYLQEKEISTSFYRELAGETYYQSIFDIQQRIGIGFSFAHISARQIDKLLSVEWSGSNYSDRIWKNTRALAGDVREELLVNLLTGRGSREAAQVIADKFAAGAGKARRLVRTESNFVSSEINYEVYKAAGIREYRFLATLDLRTSRVCQELDGKIFPVSSRRVGVNCNPMHPWCRSTTTPVIDRKYLKDMTRIARDPVTGKTFKVPATMTYAEWYKKYVAGKPEAQLEEKKIRNRASDREQHRKYRQILGDQVPKKLDDFQDMKYTKKEKWDELKKQRQAAINKMDFSEMEALKGKMGNRAVRSWYKAKDRGIPDKIDPTAPIRDQAVQAFELRNMYREQARELMKDQQARAELDKKHKNPTFEELMEHKRKKYGLSDEEAYRDIIRSSVITNKKFDRVAGLEDA